MAPRPVDPADSLGLSGFAISTDFGVNTIAGGRDYWSRTSRGQADNVAPTMQIMARKGLWPGLEVGAGPDTQHAGHRRGGGDHLEAQRLPDRIGSAVDHDHDAPFRCDRLAARGVKGPAPPQDSQLCLAFGFDVPLQRRAVSRPGVAVDPATFIDRSQRIFGVVRGTNLAHHDHVQLPLKVVCQRAAHRHRATRNGQDQR